MGTINQKIVREFLHYDPMTGEFVWNTRNRKWFKSSRDCKAWNTLYSQKLTGSLRICNRKQYKTISLFAKNYYTHRLAFMYMIGEWPENQVDHINGDGTDNRWENLREVDVIGNARNTRIPSGNQSGVIGVSWCNTHKRWRSTIVINKRQIHLIITDDFDEAVAVRKAAELKHGFHKNHGSSRPL